MQFERNVDLPEHADGAQIGIVLEGNIELMIGGERNFFCKGELYYIWEGVRHSGEIFAECADITFFDEANRYPRKSG